MSQKLGGGILAGSPGMSVANSNKAGHAELRVTSKAVEAIEGEALRWLGMPVHALGYATPVSRFDTLEHLESVDAVLDKLARGVL